MDLELEKEILHLLDRLEFLPKIKTLQNMTGRHKSPLTGSSPDFKEYALAGQVSLASDIDWRASARSEKILLRRQEHIGLIKHWLILDASSSMDFPEGQKTKYQYQLLLSGVLAHGLPGQGDSVGLLMGSEGGNVESFTPRRTREGVSELIRFVSAQKPSSDVDGVLKAVETLGSNRVRPSCVWLMTDLDHDTEALIDRLGRLREQGHDIRLVHLVHPYEKNLPWTGECRFSDLEAYVEEQLFRPERIADEYNRAYVEHREQVVKNCENIGVSFITLDITQSTEENLVQLLSS